MKVVAYMLVGMFELLIMIGWALIVNVPIVAMISAIIIAEVFSLIFMRISQYEEDAR